MGPLICGEMGECAGGPAGTGESNLGRGPATKVRLASCKISWTHV